MQQDHRLTQDINHQTKKEDIEIQQAQQNDHMHNQHEIQFIERLRQKEALENLRNQLLEQQRAMRQKHTVATQETIFLEPRSFTETRSKAEVKQKEVELAAPSNQPESKTVTITTIDEPEQVIYEEIKTTEAPINKTIEVNCLDKIDGLNFFKNN